MPPLWSLHYALTAEDALAHARLPREIRGWRKLAFFAWLALAGVTLALLPDNWTGGEADWRFWGIGALLLLVFYGLALLYMNAVNFLSARRRYPVPVNVVLDLWPDHLDITENGHQRVIGLQTIAAAGFVPTHAYLVLAPNDLIIVPRRVFVDANEMAAFIALIDDFGRDDGLSTPKPPLSAGSAG